MKLKGLLFHKSDEKIKTVSSLKQKVKKNENKMKSKHKNMDNLLKGILEDKNQ